VAFFFAVAMFEEILVPVLDMEYRYYHMYFIRVSGAYMEIIIII